MDTQRQERIEELERRFERLDAELELIDPAAAARRSGSGIRAGDPADQWAEELRARRDQVSKQLQALRHGDSNGFDERQRVAESAVTELAERLARRPR